MTEQDKKNLQIAYNLIENYFSIKDSNLITVKKRMNDPYSFVNEPIKKLFNGSPDGRVRFEVPAEFLEESDKGWLVFKNFFEPFVNNYDMKYTHFRENKISIDGGKNEIKISKALKKFFNENDIFSFMPNHSCDFIYRVLNIEKYKDPERIDFLYSLLYRLNKVLPYLNNEEEKLISDINFINENGLTTTRISRLYHYLNRLNDINDLNLSEIRNSSILDDINFLDLTQVKALKSKIVDEIIQKIMEYSSLFKLPKKSGMQIVFSRNFADWMMCSTGEKWTSCLSLESDYQACFWSGIPGLLGDPNRIMIYITDGNKKTFEGIEVDKMISRAWGVYSTEHEFNVTRWYDQKKLMHKQISEISGWPIRPKSGREFMSYEPLEPIYFRNGMSSFIYIDNGRIISDDGKFYLIGSEGSSDSYVMYSNGEVENENVWSLDINNGLRSLIDSNQDLDRYDGCEYSECEICGDLINMDRDTYFTTYDGCIICEDCRECDYAMCEETQELYPISELIEVYGGSYVNEDYVNEHYTLINDVYYPDDELVNIINEDGNEMIIHEDEFNKIEGEMIKSKYHEAYIFLENAEYLPTENDYYLISELREIREQKQLSLEYAS